jgi:membrane glycosyltransferase
LGLIAKDHPRQSPDPTWKPRGQTAILVTLCGEDVVPLANYLGNLTCNIAASNIADTTSVFVLSDTFDAEAVVAEESALAVLIDKDRVVYRRRSENTGKKPGNILEWLETHGYDFENMVILDADSRMSVSRIERMIWQLSCKPQLGLLQAGIALVPGRSRFGRHQRNASRLLSRNFGRGFAAWSGEAGNYWGHNAIMRVAAFRAAATLPHLSGSAPFGGPMLSHDFIEAAWIKRAGWTVELDPDVTGSAEDAPQTFQDFFKRDRRWCQGNLQHLRLLTEPGLHIMSRLHLILGIFSYLAAPIWVFFVCIISLKALSIAGLLPFLLMVLTLLVPKICALADTMSRAKTRRRRHVILRAWLSELGLSTLLAPLIMMRQTASVGSVLMGNDSGWKSKRKSSRKPLLGVPEAAVGTTILGLSMALETVDTVWLMPIIVPLMTAPFFMRMMEVET